jgi:hypothetical protein
MLTMHRLLTSTQGLRDFHSSTHVGKKKNEYGTHVSAAVRLSCLYHNRPQVSPQFHQVGDWLDVVSCKSASIERSTIPTTFFFFFLFSSFGFMISAAASLSHRPLYIHHAHVACNMVSSVKLITNLSVLYTCACTLFRRIL